MNGTRLNGLDGSNPLGFLAALGIQVAFATDTVQPKLWWSDDVIPHAIVSNEFTVERISERASDVILQWKESRIINPRRPDKKPIPRGDELKPSQADVRYWLEQADRDKVSGGLITSLLAEGSVDRQGAAKPSDLYFTAGQQKFLVLAREILDAAKDYVCTNISELWKYDSEVSSLGWDVRDDPQYAHRATNPSSEKKLTNPGAEALALLGLSRQPVFAGQNQTLTQGCSGSWKNGSYSWPLWNKPASFNSTKSLLAHAYDPKSWGRGKWFRAWSIFRVYRSAIRRTDQGGYGTFSPPEVVWQS